MASQPVTVDPMESTRSGPLARVAAAGAMVVLVVAVLFLPDGTTGPVAGDGTVVLASGVLERFDGDAWQRIPVGTVVPVDTELRARDDGAVIELRDGQLEFPAGALFTLGESAIDLERGSVLVATPAAWAVDAVGATATGNGAWRVDGGIAGRVAVYEGAATVESDSRSVSVPTLFEVTLVDGDLGTVAAPMRYLASDEWDRRWLADAIAIDRVVDQLQNGWRSQFPDVPQRTAFYGDFVAGLADVGAGGVADAVELLASRRGGNRFGPPVDVLTGLVFSRARSGLTDGSLSQAAGEVVNLRRAGASWGLTALLLELDRDDISAAAEAGLEERQDAVDQGVAVPPITVPTPEPPTTPGPTPSPTQPPTTQPPPNGPTDDPTEPDEGSTGDSLGNIVDELGGLLGEDSDPDDDDSVTGTLGDVLDEVGIIVNDLLP